MARPFVFFDFGGTLVRTWVSDGVHPAEFWQRTARGYGVELDPATLRQALEETDRELGGRLYEYLGRTGEFWKVYDGRVMDRLGIHDRREELSTEVDRSFYELSRGELYPEVRGVLEELRARDLTLGVISNHNDALPEILEYHRIRDYFATVTYSQEAGGEKPDRRVFELALRRAACAPGDSVYVGDSWNADVRGATSVGMRAIWLNRRGAAPPEPCEQIRDLRRIPDLLG